VTAPDPPPTRSVTVLLRALREGDREAGDELLQTVFGELRELAHARLRRLPPGQTLEPTALVHEAYLRLVDEDGRDWQGRRHFFFSAARAMHDVLVEDARRKAAQKRGGAWRRIGPEALTVAVEAPPEDLLALDDVLRRLERRAPDQARLVQLRFFVGMTEAEIADVLGVSERTVQRQWRLVRARLYAELAEDGG